jgi:hypothetical protein
MLLSTISLLPVNDSNLGLQSHRLVQPLHHLGRRRIFLLLGQRTNLSLTCSGEERPHYSEYDVKNLSVGMVCPFDYFRIDLEKYAKCFVVGQAAVLASSALDKHLSPFLKRMMLRRS